MPRPLGSKNGTQTRVPVPCKKCEKTFEVYPSEIDTWANCPDCRIHRKSIVTKRRRPSIDKICEYEFCRKPFQVIPAFSFQRFCTRECSSLNQRCRISITCRHCENSFEVPLSESYRQFCTLRCYHLYQGPSSLEIKMSNALMSHQISFVDEFKVDRYSLDFVILELMIDIECDGEYFHTDLEADIRRDEYLTSLGWTILRFTGTRIEFDLDSCIQEVLFSINSRIESDSR